MNFEAFPTTGVLTLIGLFAGFYVARLPRRHHESPVKPLATLQPSCLRDYYAGQALVGLLAQPEGSFEPVDLGEIRPRWPANCDEDRENLAWCAFRIADIMIDVGSKMDE